MIEVVSRSGEPEAHKVPAESSEGPQDCSQCRYPLGDRPVRYPDGKTYCRRCAYPTEPEQWEETRLDVRIRAATPQRCACGEALLAPISQQRGYCERCRIARKEAD